MHMPWLRCGSILEALVSDVATALLIAEPEIFEHEVFQKIRAPVVAYERLSSAERTAFLIREVQRSVGADLKRGLGRFEALLNAVALGGGVDKDISDCMFELSQTRNLIAHKASVADAQFISACPHLGLSTGERLFIDHARYEWYLDGAFSYVATLLNRARSRAGQASLEIPTLRVRPEPKPLVFADGTDDGAIASEETDAAAAES